MATLVLRAGKGSPLTNAEVDANFTNLNTEVAAAATTASWSGVTGKPATLAGYGITDAQPVDADLTAIAALAGTSGFLKKTAANTWALDTAAYLTGITSSQVTTALGFTPYNATNPSGYITASASITGNAATATALQTARTINGVSFNGTTNITIADATKLPLTGGTLTGPLVVTSTGGSATDGLIVNSNGASGLHITPASGDTTQSGRLFFTTGTAGQGFSVRNSAGSLFIQSGATYGSSSGSTVALSLSQAGALNTAGAITQNGSQVLTAGNVSTYALPIGGGTLTGPLTLNNATKGNQLFTTSDVNNATLTIKGLNFTHAVFFNDSYNTGEYAKLSGGHLGQALLRLTGFSALNTISATSDYASNYASIAGTLSATGAITQAGNQVLHAGNYNSYSPTLTGTGASGSWGISVTGSAATLTTGRTIALTGDVTYTSGSFNGSANVTGTATLAASGVTAGTYTKVTVDAKGRVTVGALLASGDLPTYAGTLTSSQITTGLGFTPASLAGATFTGAIVVPGESRFYSGTYVDPDSGVSRAIKVGALGIAVLGGIKTDTLNSTGAITQNGSQVLHAGNYNTYAPTLTGTGASGSWGISVTGSSASTTGNAATATALQTARTIGGVSFNGTANINLPGVNAAGNQNTTGSAATLTTARTLTIGSTGKTFNGSANVAWSLAEIGALGASAKAADSELLDGYNSDRFLRTYSDSSMEAGVHGGNLNGTNMQYLLAREQVQNLVAYVAPTSYETWNGSAWVSATVPTAIFRNKPTNNWGGLTIANGVTKVRFTWLSFGYKFWSTLATAGSTNGNSFRARIYTSSDNVTWVERFVSGYVTDWPGYHVWPTYYGDSAFPHMRIELEFTYVNANTCTFGDIALWGAYGSYTPLFDWDYSRNITLGGDLQLSDKFLRFDQSGTRSWNIRATGGNLDVASGDSAGLLRYNSNTILHAGNYSSYAAPISQTIYGENSTGTTALSENNLNTALKSGFYTVSKVDNAKLPASASAVSFLLHTSFNVAGNLAGMDLLTMDSTTSELYYRNATGAAKGAWRTLLHSANYSSYSPTLTGTGASGSWGISITGNAATATALQTARTINGVSFNGTANITVADSTKLPLAGGTLTGALYGNGGVYSNGIIEAQGQLRASGWWGTSSGAYSGLAVEVGVSGGVGVILTYNRNTGTWGTLNLQGASSNLQIGTAVNVSSGALQQGGNQVLHAGNVSSYALPIGGGTLTGAINVGSSGNTRSSLNTNGDFYSFYSTETSARIQLGRDIGVSGGAGLALGGSSYALIGTADTTGSALYIKLSATVATVSTSPSFQFTSAGFYVGSNQALHAGNYTSYSPSLTGTGASGSWGISVTGSAATLTTARTLWGQSFNGSANVTGALSSVTTLAMSGQLTNTVAVGTAPFVITSTTRVANLNVATAGTADTLATARTINGTSFNGSANITTANWGTARTLTLGATGKSVDGSANVAWTFSEIAAGQTITTSGSTASLILSDTGASGANLRLIGNGATTPNKTIRAQNGAFQIINSAYTAPSLTLTDGGELTTPGNHIINNASPTVYFQDTDGNSAMLHCNSNLMYILRGANNTISWTQVGGYWPVYWDLTNNNATFGGAIWAAGNITAYSDERVKENWEGLVADFVERLAEVKSGTFDRTDIKKRQAGVSAQSMQKLLPEVVDYHEKEKLLSVAYGNAALVSAVELAKDNLKLRARIERLEALVEKLIGD